MQKSVHVRIYGKTYAYIHAHADGGSVHLASVEPLRLALMKFVNLFFYPTFNAQQKVRHMGCQIANKC